MSATRQTLSKAERLKSYKRIRLLFAEGQKFRLSSLVVYYQIHAKSGELANSSPLQMGVSVGTRYFKKAVVRNLVKRRIREAYRKNNAALKAILSTHQYGLDVFFVYTNGEVEAYATLEEHMKKAMDKLIDKLHTYSIPNE